MAFFKKSKYSTLSALPRQEDPLKRKDIPEGLWEKCKKMRCDHFYKTEGKQSVYLSALRVSQSDARSAAD